MGACSSKESYGPGSNKFDPETQLTVEGRRKEMQERKRGDTIHHMEEQTYYAEKSARIEKREKSSQKAAADEEHNFETDPRDNHVLTDLFFYIIPPPITSDHFKKVFREVIEKIQGKYLREYVFESLVALFRHGLCDEHRQRDNLEFIIAIPPYLKLEWIVIKVKKSKSTLLHTFIANVNDIKQTDFMSKVANVVGYGATAAQKMIPVASMMFKWVSFNPDALDG